MPAAEILRWCVILLLSILLLFVGVSDIRDRRIPNWTVLAVAGLFVPGIFVGGREDRAFDSGGDASQSYPRARHAIQLAAQQLRLGHL